jgi:hypothetical protein
MSLHIKASNAVVDFLREFYNAIRENDLQKITEYYLIKWNEITRKNYRNTNWPHSTILETNLSLEGQFNDLFMYLYKERYYNHLFNRLSVFSSKNDLHFTLKDHAESYQNFINLFNLIIKIWV